MSAKDLISCIKFKVFQEIVILMENFRDSRHYIVAGFNMLAALGNQIDSDM